LPLSWFFGFLFDLYFLASHMHSCRVQKPTQIKNWRWQWNQIEEKEMQCRGFPPVPNFIHHEPSLPVVPKAMISFCVQM
jgi:hypothetical protein